MNTSQWIQPAVPPKQPLPLLDWLVAAFVFAASLRLGLGAAGADLDLSWSAVIAWAHVNGARWGHDIVFTYGPLGWLNCYATYNAEIFNRFVAGQILMTLATALVFAIAAGGAASGMRLALALSVVVLAPWLQADVLMLGTIMLAAAALDRLGRSDRPGIPAILATLIIAILIAVLALLKSSLLLPCFTLWVCAGYLLRQRKALAAIWIAGVPFAGLVLWLSNGQQLGDIPAYLRLSARMASDFGHAMGTPGPLWQLLTGLAACSLAGLLLVVWWWRGSRARATVIVLHLGVCLYVGWRAAFTRADPGHAESFLPICSMLLMALIACSRDGQIGGRVRALALAAALLSTLAMAAPPGTVQRYKNAWRDSRFALTMLTDLSGLRAHFEASRRAVRAEFDLPLIRASVGEQKVDLLTFSQGLLLANDFHYAPRPVFQSYAAYSAPLLRINEAHFLGPEAPPFVLFKLDALDRRYPTSEDSLALIALMRNYRPVELERGFVLLQRRADADAAPAPVAPAQFVTARHGEWVDVPDTGADAVMMHAEIPLSIAGRAYALALREPATLIDAQLSNGEMRQFRLLRGVAQAGMLLSPYLANEKEYVRWYFGAQALRVQRIRLLWPTPWQQSLLLEPQYRIGFTALHLPHADAAMPAAMAKTLQTGFDLPPVARHGMVDDTEEEGHPALFLHAQAAADFAPAPGRYSLSLIYGVRRTAYAAPECRASDGIRLQIDRIGTQPAQLFQRDLDPFARPADQGPQQLSIPELTIGAGDQLRLTVGTGPAGSNASCDWGYVRDLKLRPLTDTAP